MGNGWTPTKLKKFWRILRKEPKFWVIRVQLLITASGHGNWREVRSRTVAAFIRAKRRCYWKAERLIRAIKIAVKLRYQPQIPKAFADRSKVMQIRFEELQQGNAKMLALESWKSWCQHRKMKTEHKILWILRSGNCVSMKPLLTKKNGARVKSQTGRTLRVKEYTTVQMKCCYKNDRKWKGKIRSSWSQETLEPF